MCHLGCDTGTASEVKQTTATIAASVNPNEHTVATCKFEYGTTTAYGKTASCTPSPGSGGSPVAVSASLETLASNTTYDFRISATSEGGTNTGANQMFTTLATSGSGETHEEAKPAEAKVGELTAIASSGIGKVTVGPYGADIGGSPVPKSAGKYIDAYHEWEPNSVVTCFAKKDGDYSDPSCQKQDVKKGEPKGKYESVGSAEFHGEGGVAKLEIESVGTVECKDSNVTGDATSEKSGLETITLQGCALAKAECTTSTEKAGTIETAPLEIFIEDEPGETADTEVAQDPIATFTCGGEQYTLQGGFRGETKGDVNTMSLTSESVFKQGVGEQELETTVGGKAHKTIVTASYQTTGAHEMEIKTSVPQK